AALTARGHPAETDARCGDVTTWASSPPHRPDSPTAVRGTNPAHPQRWSRGDRDQMRNLRRGVDLSGNRGPRPVADRDFRAQCAASRTAQGLAVHRAPGVARPAAAPRTTA